MRSILSRTPLEELGTQIDAVISSGDADSIRTQPDEVVAECARRYVLTQIAQRKRAEMRSREADAKFREVSSEAKARLRAKVNLITTELAQSLHKEWTNALLAGEFSLPDGTRVSWADATVEQHAIRADQLERLAAGDMATASIHRRAINDLRDAGVHRLRDIR